LAIAHVRNYPDFLREDNHMARNEVAPIKVLQIVTRMNTGGVAVLLDDLMSSFDASKIDAVLVTGSCSEEEEDYLSQREPNYQLIKMPLLQKKINLRGDLQAFLQLRKIIQEKKITVVHTHTSKAGILGRLAASTVSPRPKRIHTFHGHLLTGYFSSIKTRLVYSVERVFEHFTDAFIAMGSRVKADLQGIGLGKKIPFETFYPGLPDRVKISREEARGQLELSQEKTYILFVGRITAVKRPDRLLEAIELVGRRHANVQFLVAGDGDLMSETRQRALDLDLPVTFLGWRSDISRLISASDIALLTSDNEAVPLTMIEASMAGLPLVATKVGSVSDVLIDGLNGYLTDTSPAALADALEKLIIDPVLRQIMGEAGRDRSHRYFSLAKMSADHTELYQRLHR
jgi:glycosyltransferase involved in cell wall biosynthesis